MLGYYKRHIVQLSMQLQELRSHPDDLQLLLRFAKVKESR
jgi:hypothetical protein